MDTALQDFLDTGLDRLVRAKHDSRSAWRTFALATASADTGPAVRMVVLRDFDRHAAWLSFFTDVRTPKVEALRADPRAETLFWDKGPSLQLRAGVRCEVLREGEAFEAAKHSVPDHSRGDYARCDAPGQDAVAPEASRTLEAEGLPYFSLVRCTIVTLDLLELDREGHRRAQFIAQRDTGTVIWEGSWVVP